MNMHSYKTEELSSRLYLISKQFFIVVQLNKQIITMAVYTYNERQSEKKKRARKLPSSVGHELAESKSIDQMRVWKGWAAFPFTPYQSIHSSHSVFYLKRGKTYGRLVCEQRACVMCVTDWSGE